MPRQDQGYQGPRRNRDGWWRSAFRAVTGQEPSLLDTTAQVRRNTRAARPTQAIKTTASRRGLQMPDDADVGQYQDAIRGAESLRGRRRLRAQGLLPQQRARRRRGRSQGQDEPTTRTRGRRLRVVITNTSRSARIGTYPFVDKVAPLCQNSQTCRASAAA
jgi:hypothetical protein